MNTVYVPADLLRQRQWMIAAVAYYRAKVLLYELMVQEWQEELDALRKEQGEPTTQAAGGEG